MKFTFTDATIAGIQLFLFLLFSIYWEFVAQGSTTLFFLIGILGLTSYVERRDLAIIMLFLILGFVLGGIFFDRLDPPMLIHTLIGGLIATLPFALRAIFWKQLLIGSVTSFTRWEKIRFMRNTIYNRDNDRKAIKKLYSAYFNFTGAMLNFQSFDGFESYWGEVYEISRGSSAELYDQTHTLIKLLDKLNTYVPSEDFKRCQFPVFKEQLEEMASALIFFCVNNHKQGLKLGKETLDTMKTLLEHDVDDIILTKVQELYLELYNREQFKEFAFEMSALVSDNILFDFLNKCRERERKHKTLNFLILQGDLERICELMRRDEITSSLYHQDIVLLKRFHTLPKIIEDNKLSYNESKIQQISNDIHHLYQETSINSIATLSLIKKWFNEFIEPLVIAKQSNNKSLTKIVALISSGLHEDLANLENVKYLQNLVPVPEVK